MKTPVNNPETEITLPAPHTEPHPLRFGILGVTDTIANLKTFVAEQDSDSDLKTFIGRELEKIKTNAATIHLHDVARLDGGFDLHLSISAVYLGARPGVVTTGAKLTGQKE